MKASIDALQNGFMTFSDISQQISGRDVEETFSTLQADLEMAERYNIDINLQPLGLKNPAQPKVDDEIETDE